MSIKLAASLLGGSGAIATLSWGGVTYLSGNGKGGENGDKSIEVRSEDSSEKTLTEPEIKKEGAQEAENKEITPKVEIPKEVSPAKTDNGAEINAKLMKLKGEKAKLLSDVENAISDHKDLMRNISSISKLESEFDKCFSKNEVSTGVTEEQKAKLKSEFNSMKGELDEYEKIQKSLSSQGEVGQSESYADKNNTDEGRYKDFEVKFNKVKAQYESAVKSNSIINFHTALSSVKDKLAIAEQNCSLKDLIKLNDELGRRNNAQR